LQIFHACQKEKEDVIKEALYKKAKYLATIEKASISSAVNLSSEDVLKRMVQEAGGALKAVSVPHPLSIQTVYDPSA
jgi:hypothetical protein